MGDTKSWMWFSNWTATSPIRELRKQVCCLSKVTWAVSSQTETALVPFFLPLHLTPSSTASGGLQRGPPQTFCQRGQSLGLALYPACSFLPTQLRGTYSALVPSQNTPLPWPTSHGYLPPHCLLLFGLLSWTPLLSSFPGRKGRRIDPKSSYPPTHLSSQISPVPICGPVTFNLFLLLQPLLSGVMPDCFLAFFELYWDIIHTPYHLFT